MSGYAEGVSNDQLADAVEHLRLGGVIALPTDTQYALSAVAADAAAVQQIFRLKRRPGSENLPIFLPAARWREHLTDIAPLLEDRVMQLAEAAWPGALTLIVPRRADWESNAVLGDTVALRIPDHPTARALLDLVDQPLTGTSANLHGEPAALSADEVRRQFQADLHARVQRETLHIVQDGEVAPAGLASTILDCSGPMPRVVRRGASLNPAIGELLMQHWGLADADLAS